MGSIFFNGKSFDIDLNFETVTPICRTTDYDAFSFIEGNRPVDHAHLLEKAMKREYLLAPICVNERLQIIDGQNRYVAIKKLGLPLYFFIIPGYEKKEMIILNKISRNWSTKNYIDFWAQEGVQAYVELKRFSERFPKFTADSTVFILQLSTATSKGITEAKNPLKDGTFTIRNLTHSYHIAEEIEKYEIFNNGFFNCYSSAFVGAFLAVSQFKVFDNDEIIRKIRKKPNLLTKCADRLSYIRQFENIANYNRRGGVIIHFDFDKAHKPIQ